MGLLSFTSAGLFWIGLSLFLTGMAKGGFPVGSIALPLLILMWPAQTQAARQGVGFMLPMLCLMDAVAMAFYWRHVEWKRLGYLIPATLVGVALASVLFVSNDAVVAVSDRMLKALIGILGICFVIYFAAKKWILRHVHTAVPNWGSGSAFGFAAGMTSTLAHAAGPVMQMYLLPQKLDKRVFAATSCAFFWMLNLVKLLPFSLMDRIEAGNLRLGVILLPVIPLGVGFGWWLTRRTQEKHYTVLICAVLLITSISLIYKAVAA